MQLLELLRVKKRREQERDAILQARREVRAQVKEQLAASTAGPSRPDTPEQQQGVIAPAGRYGPKAAAAARTSNSWEELD
jgi:hypothetical protein